MAKTQKFKKAHTTEICEVISRQDLYPLVYIFQWSGDGLLKLHLITPTFTNILIVVCMANKGELANFSILLSIIKTIAIYTLIFKNSNASKMVIVYTYHN